MPKRTLEDKVNRYKRKIQKLQEKQQRQHSYPPSGENNEGNDVPTVATESDQWPFQQQDAEVLLDQPPEQDLQLEPEPLPESRHEPITISASDVNSASMPDALPILDPEILAALGESTDDKPEFGAKIHENLANLWLPILKKGLAKETKEKIMKEYTVPENCKLLQSPKLNPEISAAISDVHRNRDKKLVTFQQQLGQGITAINRAMDVLLQSEDKISAMKHLSDSCRILSDLHFLSTADRIKLVTPNLEKSFLNVIQDSERDDSLFGSALSEKIKASKAIEKQGLQIKKVMTKGPGTALQSTAPRRHKGNWTGPPRFSSSNRRGRGGQSHRRPAYAPRCPPPQPQHQTKGPYPARGRAPTR